MSKKVPVNLLISQKMSEKRENGTIRLSQKVRNYLSLTGENLILGREGFDLEVKIKRAYKADVERLGKMRRSGELTDNEALVTGFLSRSSYQRLAGRGKMGEVWISDDSGSITIGCDPEFGLVDASGLLHRGSIVLPGSKNARFGADGPGVEVRPAPSRDHIQLVKSIGKILGNPPTAAEGFQWIGGATYRDKLRTYWFGGHIHLGRPKSISNDSANQAFLSLAKVLDHTLALPLVPFDTPNPNLRRAGCPHAYGMAEDIRVKDYGSRFEYRVPSGLWVTHPTLAAVVLGAAKAVSEDFYGRALGAKNQYKFLTDGFKAKTEGYSLSHLLKVRKTINDAKPESLDGELHQYWLRLIESLRKYKDYQAELEALEALVEAPAEKLAASVSTNLRENWEEEKPLARGISKTLTKALAAVEEKLQ